jgi:hypothetical protein
MEYDMAFVIFAAAATAALLYLATRLQPRRIPIRVRENRPPRR